MQQAQPFSTLVSALSRTLRAANACLIDLLAQEGVTGIVPSHGDILMCLVGGEPVPMQQLAQACRRDPSTVTALVKKLVALGYVEVSRCPSDGRSRRVSLTDKGRALKPRFERISQCLLEVQSQGIDVREQEVVMDVLGRVEANFRKEDHEDEDNA